MTTLDVVTSIGEQDRERSRTERVLGAQEHRQYDPVVEPARYHADRIGARRDQSLGEEIGREVHGRKRGFDLQTCLSRCRARKSGTRNNRPVRRLETSLWLSPSLDCTDYAW